MRNLLFYFPVIGITLNVIAVFCFIYLKDYPRAWYWLMAAGISISTLFIR